MLTMKLKMSVLQQVLCLLLMMTQILLTQQQCVSPTTQCDCEVDDKNRKIINCRNKALTAIPTFQASTMIYDEITFSSSQATGCSTCNNFSSIPENAFANVTVKKIDLTRVAVTSFNYRGFAGLESVLEDLRIEGAGSDVPPYAIINTLTNLHSLHLEHFRQPHMTSVNVFELLPELKSLTLKNIVDLTQIFSDTFKSNETSKLPKLVEFHLQSITGLSSLPVDAILSLRELTVLEIMGTQISNIYGLSFQSLNKLETLDINQNHGLATINTEAFNGIKDTLVHLQLEQNALTTQVVSALEGDTWTSLSQLSIGYNALGSIPSSMFSNMPKLEYLNLHQINLPSVNSSMFTGLTKLHTLDLSYNVITSIVAGSFQHNPELTDLRIEWQESGTTLQLAGNVFQGIETSLQRLVLSNTKFDLSQLWANIAVLPNLQELQIAELGIVNIPDYTFRNNIQLNMIDLSSNNITRVKQEMFYGPRDMLQTINLNNNQLQSVPTCVLTEFTNMPEMTLQGNPLICDCRLLWLYNWIHNQTNVNQAGYRNGACSTPVLLVGQYLFQVTRVSLQCDPSYTAPICKDLYTTTPPSTASTTTTTPTTTSTTQTTTTEPIPNLNIYIGQKTENSISVGWDVHDKTDISGFILEVTSNAASINDEYTIDKVKTHKTIYDLQPETTYSFCMHIIINDGRQTTKSCRLGKTLASMSSTLPTTPEPESSVGTVVIVAAAAGAVVFVVLVVIIIVLLLRYRKPKKLPAVTEGVKFTARTSGVPSEGGTARRFGKKPDPGKGTNMDDIQVTVISNGSMDNNDRFSAGSYQFINEKDPKGVHKNPMPTAYGGNYVNSLDNRRLPRPPGGGMPVGGATGPGYVNTGFTGGASNKPETSINEYSEVRN